MVFFNSLHSTMHTAKPAKIALLKLKGFSGIVHRFSFFTYLLHNTWKNRSCNIPLPPRTGDYVRDASYVQQNHPLFLPPPSCKGMRLESVNGNCWKRERRGKK
uniref:(northern house mosquito) hypothetical protein n=1 Tax=Culex pipiens TaxID=7175 RepID=A0A8D8KUP8_CULPI